MALTPDQIHDFVQLTLPNIKTAKWTDLSMEYQEYLAPKLLAEKGVEERGGPTIDFRIKTKNTGNAHHSGMFAQETSKVEDVMISASVPWSKTTGSFSYDIDEALFQSDRETIISEMVVRVHGAESDIVELQEDDLWSAPASTTDNRPMGIPFWIQKNATTADGGFTGGNPDGFTAGCAGVSSLTCPRWKNWSFTYSQVSTDDMVRKVKKALVYCKFVPPVAHPELGFGASKYNIYTTYRVVEPLERLAESRNDNLGSDVAKYLNAVTIGGTPVKSVPYLTETDTTDPLYGVNWRALRPVLKRGAHMRRSKPLVAPMQPNVRNVFIDEWMNWVCYNRRMCFVGYNP